MEFLNLVFEFVNEQILKMKWLSDLMATFVSRLMGLNLDSHWGGSLHFFLFDTLKIFILLSVLIFFVSWVQSYFPPERSQLILGRYKGLTANTIGALLGTLTPFCSCSSVPLFIGFTRAGLPIGVTFSFLISSPLVDLASILMLVSIFNWKIALSYTLVGVLLAIGGGTLISFLKMEKYVADYLLHNKFESEAIVPLSYKQRTEFSLNQVKDIFRRVWLYILMGVGIGALIHNWVPTEMITTLLGNKNGWSVPIATLIGVPIYADIFGTLPIGEALLFKNVGIGTVLAFMMSVTALSLPSLILLKKVVKMPLILTFSGIVILGIIIIGYLFNSLSSFLTT